MSVPGLTEPTSQGPRQMGPAPLRAGGPDFAQAMQAVSPDFRAGSIVAVAQAQGQGQAPSQTDPSPAPVAGGLHGNARGGPAAPLASSGPLAQAEAQGFPASPHAPTQPLRPGQTAAKTAEGASSFPAQGASLSDGDGTLPDRGEAALDATEALNAQAVTPATAPAEPRHIATDAQAATPATGWDGARLAPAVQERTPLEAAPSRELSAMAAAPERAKVPETAAPQDLSALQRIGEAVVLPAQPSTPATPASPQSAPPQVLDLGQPAWSAELVREVEQLSVARGETLTLTLTPERLGTMQVRLEWQDGQAHVHIVTETPEAARALTDAQPRLSEMMSRAGLDMGSHSATSAQSDGSGTAGQGGGRDDGSPPSTQPGEPEPAPVEPSGATPRPTVSIDLIA